MAYILAILCESNCLKASVYYPNLIILDSGPIPRWQLDDVSKGVLQINQKRSATPEDMAAAGEVVHLDSHRKKDLIDETSMGH